MILAFLGILMVGIILGYAMGHLIASHDAWVEGYELGFEDGVDIQLTKHED